jgi:mannuronan 5-epimerase
MFTSKFKPRRHLIWSLMLIIIILSIGTSTINAKGTTGSIRKITNASMPIISGSVKTSSEINTSSSPSFNVIGNNKINHSSSCYCVIFRLSGIQDYFVHNAQLAVMDLFLKRNQSLSLGLIMNNIGNDTAIVQKILEGSRKDLFALALNGWNYTNYSKLTEKEQKESLSKANEKMQVLFGKRSDIIIPPYGTFDNSTLNAMRQLGIRILSSNVAVDKNQDFIADGTSKTTITGQRSKLNQIYHMPAMTSFNTYDSTGNMIKVPINQILSDIERSMTKYGYAVINLDPQFFLNKNGKLSTELNKQEINNLSSLIDYLISKNIRITTFPTSCINYNPTVRSIIISCASANLTDVYNQLNDNSILEKKQQSSPRNGNVWLLSANMTIAKGATFYINRTDTTWLKIIADGTTVYPIQVFGSLKIDSVKITSWNPVTNDYPVNNAGSRDSSGPSTKICGFNCSIALKDQLTHKGSPRPYIRIESGATGTTDITNSEIAYLGYEGGWGQTTTGLVYLGGDGSILRGNNIDHLYFGFYSHGVGGMVVENNQFHNSGHYGFDPHTGTHDMIIRNNAVYDNNGTGIICSLNCYNITIENNTVYNNTPTGIDFSRNMTHSIAINNNVSNETNCISIELSHNNKIYDNIVSNCRYGINVSPNSSYNTIHNNTIINSTNDVFVGDPQIGNIIYSNK